MELAELAGLVALTEIDGIGDSRAYELFDAFDSISELGSAPSGAFSEFHYVDSQTHAQLQQLPSKQETNLERFDAYQDAGITLIGIDDDRYPDTLRSHHAPLVLYAKGAVDRLTDPLVSVSGSRETNEAGQSWIRELCSELAGAGRTVVSGGALGADTAAHRGALDATGATIAVLGTGVNVAYPPENAELFADIVDAGGLLLSHRPPAAEPNRYAFRRRNRTISALSPGIVIVATDGSGGTQAQYEVAVTQGRRVFVPPTGTGISPSEGIDEIRTAPTTSSVSDPESFRSELAAADAALAADADGASTEIDEESTETDEESTETDSEQTEFGDWN